MAEESGMITHQEGPNQVIHIRTDSNGILEALFNGAPNPSAKNALPLRERKLPPSFFIPPHQNQNREFNNATPDTTKAPVAGACVHVRSRSLPASMNQTLSVAPEQNTGTCSPVTPLQQQQGPPVSSSHHHHIRQKSVPASQSQLYNVVTVSDQFKAANLPDGSIVFQNRHTSDFYSDSPRVRDHCLGPLPDRWAMQSCDRGEVYYVDHSNRSTTWFDPRLPKELQEPYVHSRHQQTQLQQQQQQLPQQQRSPGNIAFNSNHPSSHSTISAARQLAQNVQPLFHDQEQQQQQQSNFNTGGYASNVHTAMQLPQQNQTSRPLNFPQQQQTRLQQLEIEREMMKNRQKEIQKQLFKQPLYNDPAVQTSQSPVIAAQDQMLRRPMGDYDMMGSSMSPLANLRVTDPFLSTHFHGRQESGDSGFSASTPHTPENFLAQNMDELSLYQNEEWEAGQAMEIVPENPNMSDVHVPQQQQQQHNSHDQHMEGQEMNDYIYDIESVLVRNDKNDPFVTWL